MAGLLRSPLLDRHAFAHGFSLRTGGVSEGPFGTLNLGRGVGDEPAHVEENHARFARAIGFAPGALFELSQVHGARVRAVDPSEWAEEVRREEGDALVARSPGVAVGVRVADCVPVLLADVRSGAVAAVHAGWRGCVAGVLDAALDALGAPAADVVAAMGPHIRVGSFEVGDEVATQLADAAPGAAIVHPRSPRPHADLAALVRAQLLARGLGPDRVDDVGGCTFGEPARFFSYRRDGRRSGRHLAAIMPRA